MDFYHHYKEDIAEFGEMGFKVYRTSVAWKLEFIRQEKRQSRMKKDWNFMIKYLKNAVNMEWKS
ncbi:MAG: family 1 glycosylhydrolase [Lachnospiraceae bacterium]